MSTPQDAGGWFKVSNAAVDLIPKIGMTAFGVLMILAKHANRQRQCWPSVQTVARAAGIKPRATRTAIAALRVEKAIKIFKRRTRSGQSANAYEIANKFLPTEKVGRILPASAAQNCKASMAEICHQNQMLVELDPGETDLDYRYSWFSAPLADCFYKMVSMLPRGAKIDERGHQFLGEVAWLVEIGKADELWKAFVAATEAAKGKADPPYNAVGFVRDLINQRIGRERLIATLKRVPTFDRFQLPLPEAA